MKVLVLSDTHGKSDLTLLAKLADTADLVIHLGDGFSDAETLSILTETPIIQVTGNVDFPLVVIPEKMITLGGRPTLLTHGHLDGVKTGYAGIVKKAKDRGANLVLFGHTHRPEHLNLDGVTLFNPGSAAFSANPRPTAGFLQIEEEGIEADWLDLKKP